MEEQIGLKGNLFVKATREGKTLQEIKNHNIVVADGKTNVASMLVADITPGSAYDFIGIGIGSTTPALADTGLVSEVEARIDSVGTATGSVASFTGSLQMSGTATVAEYGLFNKSTTGSMLSRASGTGIALISGDFLEVTWNITL